MVVYVSRNMLVFTQSTWVLLYSMSIVYIIFYTYVWWYWYMFCVDIPGSNAPPLWVGMRFLFVLILWWTVGYDTIYILNTVAPTLFCFYVALHAAKNEPLTDIYCIYNNTHAYVVMYITLCTHILIYTYIVQKDLNLFCSHFRFYSHCDFTFTIYKHFNTKENIMLFYVLCMQNGLYVVTEYHRL